MAYHSGKEDIALWITTLEENDWNLSRAAKQLDLPISTLKSRRFMMIKEGFITKDNTITLEGNKVLSKYGYSSGPTEAEVIFPEVPDDKLSADEIWKHASELYKRKLAKQVASNWLKFKMTRKGPFALAFVGDPHVDDGGTDIPLLLRDMELLEKTPGLWGVGLGDWTNAWAGRLQRLYATQEVTRSQAWTLAADLLGRKKNDTNESIWWILIKGNHDLWCGADDPLDWMSRGGALLEKWEAKFCIETPGQKQFKIWAAHDFPGTSIYNPNHGGMRKAMFSGTTADIYVSGHRHNWALFANEDSESGKPYWVARARGYKYMDDYAQRLGFGLQSYGASITAVFDPENGYSINCFADMQEAVGFLRWKRSKT